MLVLGQARREFSALSTYSNTCFTTKFTMFAAYNCMEPGLYIATCRYASGTVPQQTESNYKSFMKVRIGQTRATN